MAFNISRNELLSNYSVEVGESSSQAASNLAALQPLHGRTMILTSLRDNPVTVDGLRSYFTRTYGDVVEQIHEEETRTGVDLVYARVVFRSSSTVNEILDGRGAVEFVVDGKNVWTMRWK